MMVEAFDEGLQERLKQAEIAEREMLRLQPLASEAPQLRIQKAKAQREEERRRTKQDSIDRAQRLVRGASERQGRVPELLGNAARAVIELYTLLKEVDGQRGQASEALAIADRVDYDIELEEGEEHERSLDRDTRGLAYALAARHGESKVKQMLEDLEPDFSLLRGCNLDEPLYRDVANFIVRHAVPKEAPPTALLPPQASSNPATAVFSQPPIPQPQPAQTLPTGFEEELEEINSPDY